MYEGIVEIKTLRLNIDSKSIDESINELLFKGWELLYISTQAPSYLMGPNYISNYIMYHFGRKETKIKKNCNSTLINKRKQLKDLK